MNKSKSLWCGRVYLAHICWLSIFCVIGMTNAQVSLSPLYAKLGPAPNGQTQTTFRISNGSNNALRFRATFKYFTFDERGIKTTEEVNAESDLSSYLRAAPLEFEVPAYNEQIIRVIALVPPSALDKEMRAALVLEPLDNTSVDAKSKSGNITGQLSFEYRFIAQLYISPADSTFLEIREASQDSDGNLQVVVSNTGAASGVSGVTWQLSHNNQIIGASETSDRFVVLTKSERTRNLAEGINLPPGEYTLTGTFGVDDGGEPPVILNPQPFTKTFTVK